jgi:hypothetical protein
VALQPRPRAAPPVVRDRPRGDLAASAYDRQRALGYRDTRVLARRGDTAEVSVGGKEAWTETGLYLEPGTYRLDARGEWSSAGRSCGPHGESAGWHLSGGSSSRILGAAERVLRTAVQNPEARLLGSRRFPTQPWMSVMGLVANEDSLASGDLIEADHISIGGGTTAPVERPGYFYAFPNDAWGFYWNNGGAMRLTVSRR